MLQFQFDKQKLGNFMKCGILVLSAILLFSAGVSVIPAVKDVFARQKKEKPIYCVNTTKKQVAISFDTSIGNEDTAAILEILKKYEVRATFFLTGEWISKYPNEVKAIAADGHDLGNHSESHKEMSGLTAEQCKQELLKPHERVKQLTGIDMTLFRAPYSDYSDILLETADEYEYYCIEGDIDSLDWKDYGCEQICKKVLENPHLGNGSIVLCHSGAKYMAEALEDIICGLKGKGYEIVPVSQLIFNGRYHLDKEGRQFAD